MTLVHIDRIVNLDGSVLPTSWLAIEPSGKIAGIAAPGDEEPSDSRVVKYADCTAMPLLADAHSHLGLSNDAVEQPAFHDVEIITQQLRRYLQCGVGHVLSLGTDQPWLTDVLQHRGSDDARFADTARGYSAGIGFGAVDGWPPELTSPERRYRPTSPEQARAQVNELADRKVRILKIWVDDFGGKLHKIPWPIVRAIIDEARRRDITTFAHVYFLDDALELVEAGIHVLAHSIRDQAVDRKFADEMARRGVILVPTLAREEAEAAFARRDNPYLSDPLFRACAGPQLDALVAMSGNGDATKAERKLETALANLRTCYSGGVQVCMGTDSGFKAKLGGFAEHRELDLMCHAGMKPSEALAAALARNRKLFAGALTGIERGEPASFFVVRGNPVEAIGNTRAIVDVWLAGRRHGSILSGNEINEQ